MTDTTDWDDNMSGKETDDLIELTDIIADDAEDIIELTDIAAPEQENMDTKSIENDDDSDEEIDIELISPDESETVLTLDDEADDEVAGDNFELEIEAPKVPILSSDSETGSSVDVQVSMEQVQAALESVIEKKFADRIESILFEVMENVIEKEIGAIKQSLQKDLDEIGNS